MIEKVISGAQTGVDMAALLAAEARGIPTGGCCPKDCRTEAGCWPELIKRFNLTELPTPAYDVRTAVNIALSDVVIVIARNWRSPGTRLTIGLAETIGRHYIRIDPEEQADGDYRLHSIAKQLATRAWRTLMVAGNRESGASGIQNWSLDWLYRLFKEMQELAP